MIKVCKVIVEATPSNVVLFFVHPKDITKFRHFSNENRSTSPRQCGHHFQKGALNTGVWCTICFCRISTRDLLSWSICSSMAQQKKKAAVFTKPAALQKVMRFISLRRETFLIDIHISSYSELGHQKGGALWSKV